MDLLKSLSLIFSSFLLLTSFAGEAQEEFTSTQIKQYKKGIFEVVTLKLEDKTEYKEDFPHDLIPFQLRNDKYHSLGTAFLIDEQTFVSAAHVFDIGIKSLTSDNYAVRDSDGNIFQITDVEKYSNYRDIIQFKVKQNTDGYYKFTRAKDYEEGDTIYAAGNALGEGVIFRKGTLTSFTFEAVNGLWKNIRFSAAASPGNSGGPLLNLKGEVVGIVTKKSANENLNFAFPIKEFTDFSTKEAEFFEKQIGEIESGKRLMFGWDFKQTLPKNIIELRRIAENNFYERFQTGRLEFEKKYKNDIYPHHPNVKQYLKNQNNSVSLSIIDVNGNGEWLLNEPGNQREIKINNNQSLWFDSSDKMLGSYQYYLEKPESQPLKEFINDPKGILDTFLKSVQWNRNISNTPVYVNSYGKPHYTEQHTDQYGRVWYMAQWNDYYSDQGLINYCLPIPKGVVCDLIVSRTGSIEFQKRGYKDNLHRMMLSYSAKLKEWKEFLALPDSAIPSMFKSAKIEIDEGSLVYSFGEFSGEFTQEDLTDNSSIYISVEVNPENLDELIVVYTSVSPNINENTYYAVSKFYDLKDDASDSYADFWKKFNNQQSPYDFALVDEGEVISKKLNLGASGKLPKHIAKHIEDTGYMATCNLESKDGEAKLESTCESFVGGLFK